MSIQCIARNKFFVSLCRSPMVNVDDAADANALYPLFLFNQMRYRECIVAVFCYCENLCDNHDVALNLTLSKWHHLLLKNTTKHKKKKKTMKTHKHIILFIFIFSLRSQCTLNLIIQSRGVFLCSLMRRFVYTTTLPYLPHFFFRRSLRFSVISFCLSLVLWTCVIFSSDCKACNLINAVFISLSLSYSVNFGVLCSRF